MPPYIIGKRGGLYKQSKKDPTKYNFCNAKCEENAPLLLIKKAKKAHRSRSASPTIKLKKKLRRTQSAKKSQGSKTKAQSLPTFPKKLKLTSSEKKQKQTNTKKSIQPKPPIKSKKKIRRTQSVKKHKSINTTKAKDSSKLPIKPTSSRKVTEKKLNKSLKKTTKKLKNDDLIKPQSPKSIKQKADKITPSRVRSDAKIIIDNVVSRLQTRFGKKLLSSNKMIRLNLAVKQSDIQQKSRKSYNVTESSVSFPIFVRDFLHVAMAMDDSMLHTNILSSCFSKKAFGKCNNPLMLTKKNKTVSILKGYTPNSAKIGTYKVHAFSINPPVLAQLYKYIITPMKCYPLYIFNIHVLDTSRSIGHANFLLAEQQNNIITLHYYEPHGQSGYTPTQFQIFNLFNSLSKYSITKQIKIQLSPQGCSAIGLQKHVKDKAGLCKLFSLFWIFLHCKIVTYIRSKYKQFTRPSVEYISNFVEEYIKATYKPEMIVKIITAWCYWFLNNYIKHNNKKYSEVYASVRHSVLTNPEFKKSIVHKKISLTRDELLFQTKLNMVSLSK